MYENARPPSSAGTRSLPSRYYSDPAVFQRELEGLFYEMWLHVGREQDVARPGEYVLAEVGTESILHDEVGKAGFDPGSAVEFWEITNRQDWHLSERAQLGIGSRAYEPGPYSNREELLHALDRLIQRKVG
jgi:phenylpropionate dioxygenase-like ring-hydroxylating dioxygenase large terminal subunit